MLEVNFRECPKGEVRRIPSIRSSQNSPSMQVGELIFFGCAEFPKVASCRQGRSAGKRGAKPMEGSWPDSYRSLLISLIVFFVVSFVLLPTVNVRRARAIARVGEGLVFYVDKPPAVRANAEG